jgi:TolA-binding protein
MRSVSWLAMPSDEYVDQDQESLRARSEQAIGELAQALLDSQMLENALTAAFGARDKAHEAQQAAMAALNLPSASDVERLERRLRSVSERIDDLEDQIDRVGREVGELRRQERRAPTKAEA